MQISYNMKFDLKSDLNKFDVKDRLNKYDPISVSFLKEKKHVKKPCDEYYQNPAKRCENRHARVKPVRT